MWTDRQTDTQTEKDVNPTSGYSTGFSKRNTRNIETNTKAKFFAVQSNPRDICL